MAFSHGDVLALPFIIGVGNLGSSRLNETSLVGHSWRSGMVHFWAKGKRADVAQAADGGLSHSLNFDVAVGVLSILGPQKSAQQ